MILADIALIVMYVALAAAVAAVAFSIVFTGYRHKK